MSATPSTATTFMNLQVNYHVSAPNIERLAMHEVETCPLCRKLKDARFSRGELTILHTAIKEHLHGHGKEMGDRGRLEHLLVRVAIMLESN